MEGTSGTLRTFARGQVVFALLAILPELGQIAWHLFAGGDTLAPIAIILVCLTAAFAGRLALFLLGRGQSSKASIVFVVITVGCITAALPVQGVQGNLVLYLWPTICAALLLGRIGGSLVALLCAMVGGISYLLELLGVYRAISGMIYHLQSFFDYTLALGLVVVAATVAGGAIRSSLAAAEERGSKFAQLFNEVVSAARIMQQGAKPLAAALSSAAEEQNHVGQAQANLTTEFAAQISSVAGTATGIANLASKQKQLNQEMSASAYQTSLAADAASTVITHGLRQTDSTASTLAAAKVNAAKLNRLVELLDDIVEETHILAINAALEAASISGEHGDVFGRRFGVIAKEMGDLSTRSQQHLKDATEQVQSFLSAMDGSERSVDDLVKAFRQIAESIASINAQTSKVADMSRQAEQSSIEVAAATKQLTQSADEAATANQHLAAGAEQSARAAREVASSARTLDVVVQQLDDELSKATEIADTNPSYVGTPPNSPPHRKVTQHLAVGI